MVEPVLEELTLDECMQMLRIGTIGRIAFTVDDFPMIFPVNYRLVETSAAPWIALRTRPGNVIARAPLASAFEIDGHIDARKEGWSVLVRGTLEPIDPDAADFRERFDPEPWVPAERDRWLAIAPFAITGRRLIQVEQPWELDDDLYR
jgi:nitroimidazol reductase NimA-like FMN-containing flavoprotein (pyridoxamine 5'-phosphate oxidase superfamily)